VEPEPSGTLEFMLGRLNHSSKPRYQDASEGQLLPKAWEPWPEGQRPCQPHPAASKEGSKGGLGMAAGISNESRSSCRSMVTWQARLKPGCWSGSESGLTMATRTRHSPVIPRPVQDQAGNWVHKS